MDKMKKCNLCLLMLLLFAISPVFGEDKQSEQLPENIDWHKYMGNGKTNIDMKEKGDVAIAALNNRMKTILGSIKNALTDRQKTFLEESQSAWRKSAKARRSLLASRFRGGTHAGLEGRSVFIAEQKQRIKELLNIAKAFDIKLRKE